VSAWHKARNIPKVVRSNLHLCCSHSLHATQVTLTNLWPLRSGGRKCNPRTNDLRENANSNHAQHQSPCPLHNKVELMHFQC
jgi:hypothetical protein